MRKRSGFTLIELLVVIAIIAILAAILFPVFERAQSSARRAHCLNNLGQMGKGMKMYLQDYSKLPSYGGVIGSNDSRAWANQILKYTGKSKAIFTCRQLGKFPDGYVGLTYVLNWQITAANLGGSQVDTLVSPSKLIAIYEMNRRPKAGEDTGYWPDWDRTNEDQMDDDPLSNYWWWFRAPGPHNGALCLLLFDGHVTTVSTNNHHFTLGPRKRNP